MTAQEVRLLEACTVVEPENIAEEELPGCFSFEEIPDSVFERMKGKSYGHNCTIPCSELRYVRVLHYGFDGKVHIGELVVNRAIARDITDIFRELFDAQYPVEKMLLIDEYGADDNASMADNNTSSFNFRFVEGTSTVSLHAYGLAVDINPRYNPYLPMRDGLAEVLPENGKEYADRSLDCIYYIRPGDVCYQAFVSRGFSWGGDWSSSKDYQHFSKNAENL
ncbi:MAG: M15 family metallopeptidase [Lachnospiraceae bacterium]|nr:M15 family metallopeptidase [Lachnospiraceae bacterium]